MSLTQRFTQLLLRKPAGLWGYGWRIGIVCFILYFFYRFTLVLLLCGNGLVRS